MPRAMAPTLRALERWFGGVAVVSASAARPFPHLRTDILLVAHFLRGLCMGHLPIPSDVSLPLGRTLPDVLETWLQVMARVWANEFAGIRAPTCECHGRHRPTGVCQRCQWIQVLVQGFSTVGGGGRLHPSWAVDYRQEVTARLTILGFRADEIREWERAVLRVAHAVL